MKKVTKRMKNGSYKRVWKLEFKDWVSICAFMLILDYIVWECIR